VKGIAMAIGVYFVEYKFGYSMFVFKANGCPEVVGRWRKLKDGSRQNEYEVCGI